MMIPSSSRARKASAPRGRSLFVLHNYTGFSSSPPEMRFTSEPGRTVAELMDFITAHLQPDSGDGAVPFGVRVFRSRGADDTPGDADEVLGRRGEDGGTETVDRAFGEGEHHLHGYVNPAAGRRPLVP